LVIDGRGSTTLAHRYTRGALIVTSNLEFADWTTVFGGDERLTAALLDRLTHRCHLLEFRGFVVPRPREPGRP
jgi:DNA replication protein DnaC